MTYIADLAPYDYLPQTVPAGTVCRAVGRLERGRPLPTGIVPEGFTKRLGRLCRDERWAATRSFHSCDLGGHPAPGPDHDPDIPLPASHANANANANVDGAPVALGSSEVRVIAPTAPGSPPQHSRITTSPSTATCHRRRS